MSSAGTQPSLRVLGVQIANLDATCARERDENIASACAYIRQHPGHDVYVLCEMSSVGYGDKSWLPTAAGLAEDAATGPSCRAFGALAEEMGAFVVFGFPRRDDGAEAEARPTISQSVVGPDGARVGTYDKLHLCGYGDCAEPKAFRAGDHLLVFEARGFRLGVLICYDVRFPEVWSALARSHGVDAILHPSCFPNDGSFATWHSFVITRAVENQLYVLSLSRAHPHFGNSIAVGPCPPDAERAASRALGVEQGVLPMLVERHALSAARAEYAFGADRREDYAELAVHSGGT